WSWAGSGDGDAPSALARSAAVAACAVTATSFGVSFTDVAPTVTADHATVSAAENAPAANTGAFADFDDAVTITASSGTVTQSGNIGRASWREGTGDAEAADSATINGTN